MTRNKLSKVRHLAVSLVLGNFVLIAVLAAVLPASAQAALPVLALMLPLLSAAAIDGALTKQSKPARAARRARLPIGSALRHAA